jgi:hypothetical protein
MPNVKLLYSLSETQHFFPPRNSMSKLPALECLDYFLLDSRFELAVEQQTISSLTRTSHHLQQLR